MGLGNRDSGILNPEFGIGTRGAGFATLGQALRSQHQFGFWNLSSLSLTSVHSVMNLCWDRISVTSMLYVVRSSLGPLP